MGRHWKNWWEGKLPTKRQEGWPKMCLASWLKSFIRWEDSDESKVLEPATLGVIRETMQANLLYIEELEAENAKQREALELAKDTLSAIAYDTMLDARYNRTDAREALAKIDEILK